MTKPKNQTPTGSALRTDVHLHVHVTADEGVDRAKIAADLGAHIARTVGGAAATGPALASPAGVAHAAYGPVVLVLRDAAGGHACERYARITGLDAHSFLVQWAGAADPEGLHLFSRGNGECVGSRGGEMRGYEISDADMARLGIARPGAG